MGKPGWVTLLFVALLGAVTSKAVAAPPESPPAAPDATEDDDVPLHSQVASVRAEPAPTSVAPPLVSSRVQLRPYLGAGGWRREGTGYATLNGSSWRVNGGAQVTVFPHRSLVDDGAPRSLQIYLQKLDTVWVDLAGSYDVAHLALAESRGVDRSATVGGRFWIGGYLFVEAGLGYFHSVYSYRSSDLFGNMVDNESDYLTPRGELGGRLGVTQLSVSYARTWVRDSSPRFGEPQFVAGRGWGAVAVELSTVVVQTRLWLHARAQLFEDGGFGFLSAEYFLRPAHGLFGGVDAGVSGAGSRLYATTFVSGWIGVDYWFTPRLGGTLSVGLMAYGSGVELPTSPGARYRGDGSASLYIRL